MHMGSRRNVGHRRQAGIDLKSAFGDIERTVRTDIIVHEYRPFAALAESTFSGNVFNIMVFSGTCREPADRLRIYGNKRIAVDDLEFNLVVHPFFH